jgi:sucrose phosphorylase
MVYNFSLPPLVLHGLLKGSSRLLSDWSRSLPDLSPEQAFFNFSASHDGIGVRPLQGLLPEEELDWVIGEVKAHGGEVSMKADPDGSQSPYELNITFRDALSIPGDPELSLPRFLVSQAIVLAFKGVPAVYIHSLLGTPNDNEGVAASGRKRSINRKKLDYREVCQQLEDPASEEARIFKRLNAWLRTRGQHPAFHPGAAMEIMDLGGSLFGFIRTSRTGVEKVACLFNLSDKAQKVAWADCFPGMAPKDEVRELLSGQMLKPKRGKLVLQPYFGYWLMIKGGRKRSEAKG